MRIVKHLMRLWPNAERFVRASMYREGCFWRIERVTAADDFGALRGNPATGAFMTLFPLEQGTVLRETTLEPCIGNAAWIEKGVWPTTTTMLLWARNASWISHALRPGELLVARLQRGACSAHK